jgi:uncharacterized sulfatase
MGFTHGMTTKVRRHGGAGLTIGREGNEPVYDFIDMSVAEEKPFFVWYAPFLPHDPHNPPERLLKKYRGQGPTKHGEVYHAMVEWLDEACGDLDGWLDAKGLKENTVILYLSLIMDGTQRVATMAVEPSSLPTRIAYARQCLCAGQAK